ncbi:autotransporter outer membrane beta-barrel domain-containing protein, partial [Roseococcus sp.]|uniref:autotransporter outer membrane beta-barrel domain-containing protein n=1 Tax=Roseococcus sp. TaxID=2109646 RepID=UPI003BA863CD
GARVQFTGENQGILWQPYGKINLWQGSSGTDRATFAGTTSVETRFGDTALEVGAGVTARVSRNASLYAHAGYLWSIDGGRSQQDALRGAVGLRLNW